MKRRRHSLQVSTFPFLAVLLCAMGSLILLLLVIDRRAKVVMRAKALAAIRQMEAEDSKDSAARAAEWEQRSRALHEQLQQQKQELDVQSASIERQVVDTDKEIKTEQSQTAALDKQLQAEKENLFRVEKAVGAGVHEANQKKAESEAASAELTRQSGELMKMEQTLEDLKSLRQRQQQTYSLVPYRGRRGDNRRPIYLECGAESLIFHPDRLVLPATDSSSPAILQEVERRINRQQPIDVSEPSKQETPYLLLLVRPGGIATYYRALAALRNLKVDFGYEFVESDWVLDFPQDGNALQPWMTSEAAPPLSGSPRRPDPARSSPQPPTVRNGSDRPNQENGGALAMSPSGQEGIRGQVSGVRGQESEARGQESGVRGQESGVRGQESGVRGQESGGGPDEDAPPQMKGWRGFPDSGEFNRLRHFASLPTGAKGDRPSGPGEGAANGPQGLGGFAAGTAVLGPTQQQGSGVTLGAVRPRGVSFAGTAGSVGGTGSDDQGQSGFIGSGTTGERGESSPRSVASQNRIGGSLSRDPTGERAPEMTGNTPSFSPADSSSGMGLAGSGTGGGVATAPAAGNSNFISGQSGLHVSGQSGAPAGTAPYTTSATSATGAQSGPSLTSTFGGPSSQGSGRSGASSADATPPQGGTPEKAGVPALAGSPAPPQGGTPTPRESEGSFGSSSALSQLGAERERKPAAAPIVHRYVRPEWNIFVECAADHVIVYPGGLRIPTNSFGAHGKGSQSLLQAIQQMIAHRQAVVASSETSSGGSTQLPQIRFLVRPNGLRTYFFAYPQLEALHLPMTRENLDAKEDAVRHMMGR
jgi:hypothetical protein